MVTFRAFSEDSFKVGAATAGISAIIRPNNLLLVCTIYYILFIIGFIEKSDFTLFFG